MSLGRLGTGETQRSAELAELEDAPRASARFDVVALVTSTGGLEALRRILRDLPHDFHASLVVAQHLGGQGSALVEILSRETKLPVEWAAAGTRLTAGRVFVCPPRRQLEVVPDGTCVIDGGEIRAREKPLDVLLGSIADSYGPRALAVVLTGMGKDSAVGAGAIKRAGGVVLVQSEETAEQPSMPRAAIESGAADLVLPLHEIATVIAQVVSGGDLPRPRTEIEAAEAMFSGPGEVRRLLRTINWPRLPLGPLAQWPASLRTTVQLVLDSPMPMLLLWGPDRVHLYNDPYRLVMGDEYTVGLGQPTRGNWPGLWHLKEELYAHLLSGVAVSLRDALCSVTRHGLPEDAWFDLNFAPVRGDDGTVAAVLGTIVETTARVLSQRRLRTLQALTIATAGATNVHAAVQRALGPLTGDGNGAGPDVPFALAYLLDTASGRAQLAAAVGIEAGGPLAPRTIDVRRGHPVWPLSLVLNGDTDQSRLVLDDLAARFGGVPHGTRETVPTSAILLALRPSLDKPSSGVLVCGLNPRLVLDDTYLAFLELVASRVSASVAEAQLRQGERERLDRLAELDRAKTEFFNNVSHEFRTPLTLMLAPLDALSRRQDQLPAPLVEEMRVAARNARRLLNQVNTLLDFSQAETARLRADFEPTDLAALTRDIASVFRSAVERAGLRLRVQCQALAEPVWVDSQMWEKIVSNLLSNALKFTFDGEIAVELRPRALHAELVVSDTGVGIPADDQPHVFKRFHRVRGRRGRTNDGSGIGLALVHELVRLHQGRVRLQSVEGEGTTLTVWMPIGRRLVRAYAREPVTMAPVVSVPPWTPAVAAVLADEAAGWTNGTNDPRSAGEKTERIAPDDVADDILGPPTPTPSGRTVAGARILVVDDNADMRDYLGRLLKGQWNVAVAGDGAAALAAMRRERPDVVVADVMMPGLDGFELLTQIRGDEALKYTPVILVTARAGEQAALDGLSAGADDYITKPFSPRELVARVHAVIERSRVEAELRDRAVWLRGQREALEAAVNGAPLETSLGALVRATCETQREGTRAAFYLANHDGTTLHHLVGMPADYAEAVDGFKIGTESLACGLAAATGEPVLTPDVMTEPRWESWRSMAERFDYRGCWSFPIHSAAGKFVGSFAMYWRQPRQATPRDLELASLLGQTASIIIAQYMESQARRQAEEALQQSRADALRDLESARHLQNVSSLLLQPGTQETMPAQILDAAMAITGADFGSIQRLNAAGQLELLACRNLQCASAERWGTVSSGSGTVCGAALERATRVIVPDVQSAGDNVAISKEVLHEFELSGIRAVQSTPLVSSAGRIVGVISSLWRQVHMANQRELALLDVLARQAADYFERRRA